MGQESNIRADIDTNPDALEWSQRHSVWWLNASNFVGTNNLDEFAMVVHNMKPEALDAAAAAYHEVARRMRETTELIYHEAGVLAENWGGDAYKQNREQLQGLYDNARQIYRTCEQTSRALQAHAELQRAWKQAVDATMTPDSLADNNLPWQWADHSGTYDDAGDFFFGNTN